MSHTRIIVPLLAVSMLLSSCSGVTLPSFTKADGTTAPSTGSIPARTVDPEQKGDSAPSGVVDNRDNVNNAPTPDKETVEKTTGNTASATSISPTSQKKTGAGKTSPGVAGGDKQKNDPGVASGKPKRGALHNTKKPTSSSRSHTGSRKDQEKIAKVAVDDSAFIAKKITKKDMSDPDVGFFISVNNKAADTGTLMSEYMKKLPKKDQGRLMNVGKKIGVTKHIDTTKIGPGVVDITGYYLFAKTQNLTNLPTMGINPGKIVVNGSTAVIPKDAITYNGHAGGNSPGVGAVQVGGIHMVKVGDTWKIDGQRLQRVIQQYGSIPIGVV